MNIEIETPSTGKIEATIKNDEKPFAVLRIKKGNQGWLHTWTTPETSKTGEFKKPIWNYSPDSLKSKAAKWVKKAFTEKNGTPPENDWFKTEVWKPLIEAFEESEETEKFKENAAGPAVQELRSIIEKITIEAEMDDEDAYPVQLHINAGDKKGALNLTTDTLDNLRAVKSEFLKSLLWRPDALTDIEKSEWETDVINWCFAEGKVERIENPDTTAQTVAETVRKEVRELSIVTTSKELAPGFRTAYYDGHTVWIPSSGIREMLDNRNLPCAPREVKNWLIKDGQLQQDPEEDSYKSKVRGEGRGRARCWPFKPEVFEGTAEWEKIEEHNE